VTQLAVCSCSCSSGRGENAFWEAATGVCAAAAAAGVSLCAADAAEGAVVCTVMRPATGSLRG
jgi:hypothetical protein